MTTVTVRELIGSPTAVSPRKGLIVYEKVKGLIQNGEKVVISFAGIEDMVTAFSNAAFGRLYMELPKNLLDENLQVESASEIWMSKIRQAIRLATNDTARDTHANSIDEILNS